MIGAKAFAEAQVNLARAADVIRSLPISRPVAAVLAISLPRSEFGTVDLSGCMGRRWVCPMLARPDIGWKLPQ